MRRVILVSLLLTAAGVVVAQDTDFDISSAIGRSFSDVALLPTRLTSYNQHDDAARASYTCCKPWQEEEIALAIKANYAFLLRYPTSDFADDTCLHNAYVNSVKRDFRAEMTYLRTLLANYPQSDLADDAAWKIGVLCCRDKDHLAAIQTLNLLITRWPKSTWADDAHFALAGEFKQVEDEAGYLQVLQGLANGYPASDYCPKALCMLAEKYKEVENYEAAIQASQDLMRRFPASDCLDDCQFRIAESLRHMGKLQEAAEAYRYLIERMPGSQLSNRAIREANTLRRQITGRGLAARGQYDAERFDPGREAQDLWEYAQHLQNYRAFRPAVDRYQEFVRRFPGHDSYDDALFNIGVCYQQMNILFQDINKAEGPEDLFRFQDAYQDAVGAAATIPGNKELSALKDATSAFALVVNRLVGSPLRDDALYEIAKSYEDSERLADMAYTYQQLVIHFPGSEHEMEALYETLKFYADPKNLEKSKLMYGELAKAAPHLFPTGMTEDEFMTLMRAYYKHVDFGWFEYHHHHIPYRVTFADLEPDAAFYLAGLNMARGNIKQAQQQLAPLVSMTTNDYCAPGTFLLAQAYEADGNLKKAEAMYGKIIQDHAECGLADDAKLALSRLGSAAPEKYVQLVRDNLDYSVGKVDCYDGERVVVFAPYMVTVKMRQYNLPNIWEEAQRLLCDWTARPADDKVVIVVDQGCRRADGNPMMLPGCKIGDPPDWSLGFEGMAKLAINGVAGSTLATGSAPYVDGIAKFAAASLQYDLVTETRDAIGSAAAVALPQEDVIKARKRALDALQEYVRAGQGQPDAEVVAGMLYALLDNQGFSETRLIDREPYRSFFAALVGPPADAQPAAGAAAFAYALNATFGGNCGEQLEQWGLPLGGAMGG
jgi:TolA-binding protein